MEEYASLEMGLPLAGESLKENSVGKTKVERRPSKEDWIASTAVSRGSDFFAGGDGSALVGCPKACPKNASKSELGSNTTCLGDS